MRVQVTDLEQSLGYGFRTELGGDLESKKARIIMPRILDVGLNNIGICASNSGWN